MITAEDLISEVYTIDIGIDSTVIKTKDVQKLLKKFAKMHVKAALEAVNKKSYALSKWKEDSIVGYRNLKDENNNTIGKPVPIIQSRYFLDKESILNAYPLENIK